jgi:hypothetical protein
MKQRTIEFPFDGEEKVKKTANWLTKYLGKENICVYGLDYEVPEIVVKCTKKQWKDIKFKLNLGKVYI